MILAETALSFLGLGLQPPMVSWGVLLQEAQNIRAVRHGALAFSRRQSPWSSPCLPSISSATALRDAADPYRQ